MKIFVVNNGSSSIKTKLFEMPKSNELCSINIGKIGDNSAEIDIYVNNKKNRIIQKIINHDEALKLIIDKLIELRIIDNINDISAVGHRVVHGGDTYSVPTIIDINVKDKIKHLSVLAPLHNPVNLKGIELCEKIIINTPQIAVFDTSFHNTIPTKAHRYAIPSKYYEMGIKQYGFHGISHEYVSKKLNSLYYYKKIISIHLGNGCSITAIKNGKSVEHSLGFAPANGLIMGTRSGDIDHSIIFYLYKKLNMNIDEINDEFVKNSGLISLIGSNDMRELEKLYKQKNKNAKIAMKMIVHRIKKYIGAYISIMNGVDAIIFTGGIGENSEILRRRVCDKFDYLEMKLDKIKNNIVDKREINEVNTSNSKVKIFVVPTNEELEIAIKTYKLIN